MANFPLLRANLAAWVGAVLSSEFWAFDERISKTINAAEGSTHAPTSPIVIGGDGVNITGPALLPDVDNIVATACDLTGVTNFVLTGANQVEYAARVLAREASICDGSGTSWAMSQSGVGASRPVWAASTNTVSYLWIRLSVPLGSTLVTVRAYLQPAAGHAGVPGTVPHVGVYSSPLGSDVATLVGAAAPAFAGTLAEYHAGYQAIAIPNAVIAADTTYWLRVTNEFGTDALAALKLVSVRTACGITSQDEHLI